VPPATRARRGSGQAITGDRYLNGTELAKKLDISRTALGRRIKAGCDPDSLACPTRTGDFQYVPIVGNGELVACRS
jgi:hypothetical protein